MFVTILFSRIILTAIEFGIAGECLKSQDYAHTPASKFSNKYTIPRILQILFSKKYCSHIILHHIQCLNKIFLFSNKRISLMYFIITFNIIFTLFSTHFVWIKTNQICKKKIKYIWTSSILLRKYFSKNITKTNIIKNRYEIKISRKIYI